MSTTAKFIKHIDLFSTPFSFLVRDKRNKKTLFGGILSLLILLIAIVYFFYLAQMYFSNQFEPKINLRNFIDDKKSGILIGNGQIIFEFLINGQPLKQYEKIVGKTYLTYIASFNQYYKDGSHDNVKIPISQYQQDDFLGFLTIDEEAMRDKAIEIDPFAMTNTQIEIEINPCDPSIELNCASEQETLDLIFTLDNYMQIFTKIEQYNPTSCEYEYSYRSEYLYFDPNLIIYSRFNLMKTKNIIKSGVIIQSEKEQYTVNDYKKIDFFFSAEDLMKRMEIKGYGLIAYDLNQSQNVLVIQYPMITEVLAQFMSVYNTLLLFGFLARVSSSKRIVEELEEVLLKEYYKKTAVKLLKIQQLGKKSKANNEQNNSIMNQKIKINEEKFFKKKKQFFKFGMLDRFKIFFFKLLKKQQKNKEDNREKQIYQKLKNLSLKKMNIIEIFKDLYQLKIAIKLILTKEQYAAIQYCGSEIYLENSKQLQDNLVKDNSIQQITNNNFEILKKDEAFLHYKQVSNLQKLSSSENFIQPYFSNKIEDSFFFENKQFLCSSPSLISPKNENNLFLRSIQKNLTLEEKKQQFNKQLQQKRQKEGTSESSLHLQPQFTVKNFGDIPLDQEESIDCQFLQKCFQSNKFEDKQTDFHKIDKSIQNKIEIPDCIQQKQLFQQSEQQQQQQKQKQLQVQQQQQLQKKEEQITTPQTILRSHLQEMDLIEENFEVSSEYLHKFLKKLKEEGNIRNIINNQIFQSLLMSD